MTGNGTGRQEGIMKAHQDLAGAAGNYSRMLPVTMYPRTHLVPSCGGACRFAAVRAGAWGACRPLVSSARRLRCTGNKVRATCRFTPITASRHAPLAPGLSRCLWALVELPARRTGAFDSACWHKILSMKRGGYGAGSHAVTSTPRKCVEPVKT